MKDKFMLKFRLYWWHNYTMY